METCKKCAAELTDTYSYSVAPVKPADAPAGMGYIYRGSTWCGACLAPVIAAVIAAPVRSAAQIEQQKHAEAQRNRFVRQAAALQPLPKRPARRRRPAAQPRREHMHGCDGSPGCRCIFDEFDF